jgi:uncharacterized membrane protein YraQ (UPF0718 family)
LNTLIDTIKYFVTIMAELVVLFIAISTIIAFALMYIPQDKLKKWMSGKGIWGHIIAVLFGAVTPFCACSTVPITLGFIQAGVPFGTVMTFVIASPLMDPLVFIMLGTFMGWDTAVIFLILTSVISIAAGITLEKLGWADQVKKVRMKEGADALHSELPKGVKGRLKIAFIKAWGDFKSVFVYMIIGVAVGSAIYGYLPEALLTRVAGADNQLAVLIIALIGMPLYIRVESAIPIGLALLKKGASMGSVIALIISGAGIAIPELTMFAGIFKRKIIIAFIVIVFVMAVVSGLIFNLLLMR